MLRVACPKCLAKLNIKDEYTGKKLKCPKCGQVFAAPMNMPQEEPVAQIVEHSQDDDLHSLTFANSAPSSTGKSSYKARINQLKAKNKTRNIVIAIVAIIATLAFIGIIASHINSQNEIPASKQEKVINNIKAAPKNITVLSKSEWRAKVQQIVGGSVSEFEKIVGKPFRTQTIGERAYWYYKCSDGVIQLVLDADLLYSTSIIIIEAINDY